MENTDIQEFDGNYIDYNFALLQKKIELQEMVAEEQEEIARAEKMVERLRAEATKMSIASLGRTVHAKQTYLDRLKARAIKEPFVDIRLPKITLPEVEVDAEEVVLSVPELGPHYEIIVEREGYADKLTVRVELNKETDSFAELQRIEQTTRNKLKVILGLDAKIRLESPNTLQRFEGKAKRIKDLRKL